MTPVPVFRKLHFMVWRTGRWLKQAIGKIGWRVIPQKAIGKGGVTSRQVGCMRQRDWAGGMAPRRPRYRSMRLRRHVVARLRR